ncbi:GIY-YIG nuclease family protein [Citrifermentans bremense]|uniref:GIY-YIG nuclease family protein n=1 Tax=Citrifermentans bremense TaxID=60035 RepID=UPI00040B46BB|nr:GIY-YIG nuclease family protein [Citrifermentans bremense]
MPGPPKSDATHKPPFETEELRQKLTEFLDSEIEVPASKVKQKIGNFQFGIYAFYDYDKEPIYVGQTNEKIRTRIRRHLTNQRTDAVAMNVLDPFEVYQIEVWPLPELEGKTSKDAAAKKILNALEYQIFIKLRDESSFKAVLNEKEPGKPDKLVEIPRSYKGTVVSDEVFAIRNHPDVRIARRAATLSRLAQIISERQVQKGLRNTLLTQAIRLRALAERRLRGLEEKAKKTKKK